MKVIVVSERGSMSISISNSMMQCVLHGLQTGE
jgi:hypothetical protein